MLFIPLLAPALPALNRPEEGETNEGGNRGPGRLCRRLTRIAAEITTEEHGALLEML